MFSGAALVSLGFRCLAPLSGDAVESKGLSCGTGYRAVRVL